MVLAEGLADTIARHARVGKFARDEVKSLGLPLFADENHDYNAVSAVASANGLDIPKLVKITREEHSIVLGGGQLSLAGKIFRIGHMGWVTEKDIETVVSTLELALPKAGFVK